MHFEIEVNGRPHAVTVERTGTRYRIEADGRVDVVDVARVDAHDRLAARARRARDRATR